VEEKKFIYEVDNWRPKIIKIEITRRTDKSFWVPKGSRVWGSGIRRIGREHHDTFENAKTHLVDLLTVRLQHAEEEVVRQRENLETALNLTEAANAD